MSKNWRKMGKCLLIILSSLIFSNFMLITARASNDPTYAVSAHITRTRIFGSKNVTVGYSITGMGRFDYGAVIIESDIENILINTYNFKQGVYSNLTLRVIDEINLANMSNVLVSNWMIVTRYYEGPADDTHHLTGTFIITTKDMPSGMYSITVLFVIRNFGENYIFRDTIEYEIIGARTFDIINLFLASIGAIGGFPLLWRLTTKPNIIVSNVKVRRWTAISGAPVYDDDGHIVDQEDIEANTVVEWRVYNKPKFYIFKKDVHDLKTKYSFGKINLKQYENYQWSGETHIWPLLGCNQDYSQRIEFKKYCIPNGEYILNLNVMSGNMVLHTHREPLTVNEKTLRQWLKE